MKKIIAAGLLCFSLIFCSNLYAAEEVRLTYNGEAVVAQQHPPFFKDGNLYASTAFVAEQMGVSVKLEEDNMVRFTSGTRIVLFQTGGDKTLGVVDRITGDITYLDMSGPAWRENGVVTMPLRSVVEALGGSVSWDGESGICHIIYNKDALEGPVIPFVDPGMEAIARYVAGHVMYGDEEIFSGEFRQAQANTVTVLSEEYLPEGLVVHSISDIIHFPNLTRLGLSNQNIKNASPLGYRTQWDKIFLDRNPLQDAAVFAKLQINEALVLPYYYYYAREMNGPITPFEAAEYAISIEEYQQVHQKVAGFLAKYIKDGMSDREKVTAIHDFIVNNTDYDYEHMSATDKNLLYELLVNGKAICGGYAATTEELCRLAGVECILVFGDAYGVFDTKLGEAWDGHVWNIVTIEGKNYHLDVTFDDPIYIKNGQRVSSEGPISYEYFLLSDKELKQKKDHRWDEKEYPACVGGQ